MTTFFLAFLLLTVVMLAMAVGVMMTGRQIKGSCGGLNNLSDDGKCSICQRDAGDFGRECSRS